MLDINGWFFVQLANFLLLLYILDKILYKPIFRIFNERAENTQGALDRARAMDKEREDLMGRIDAKLAEAREKARVIFEDLSSEGMEMQRQALDEANSEAMEKNRQAKKDLENATKKARAALKSDIENFSKQIVGKLVGA